MKSRIPRQDLLHCTPLHHKILHLLCVVIVAAGIACAPSPLTSQPSAYATEGDGLITYNLAVNNVMVTSANASDILGDGTASYDPETNTLTLNNADITTADPAINALDITINLVGNNRVTSTNNAGIMTRGNCTITGSGSLVVSGQTHGIIVPKTLTILADVESTSTGTDPESNYAFYGVSADTLFVGEGKRLSAETQIGPSETSRGAAIVIQGGTFTNNGTVTLAGDVREITFLFKATGVCGDSAVSPHDEDDVCLICGKSHLPVTPSDPEDPNNPGDPSDPDNPNDPNGSNGSSSSSSSNDSGASGNATSTNQSQGDALAPTGDSSPAAPFALTALGAALALLGCAMRPKRHTVE